MAVRELVSGTAFALIGCGTAVAASVAPTVFKGHEHAVFRVGVAVMAIGFFLIFAAVLSARRAQAQAQHRASAAVTAPSSPAEPPATVRVRKARIVDLEDNDLVGDRFFDGDDVDHLHAHRNVMRKR